MSVRIPVADGSMAKQWRERMGDLPPIPPPRRANAASLDLILEGLVDVAEEQGAVR